MRLVVDFIVIFIHCPRICSLVVDFIVKRLIFPDRPILTYGLIFPDGGSIGLPKYPSSMEELLAIDDPNQFCFARAMGVESTNGETVNIHYTAHQF